MVFLVVNNNELKSLDLSHNKMLEDVMCEHNQLTSIKLDGCINLTRLNVQNNQLSTLQLPSLPKLSQILCAGNGIKDEAMDNLIASLRQIPQNALGHLKVVNKNNIESLRNNLYKLQAEAAQKRGWTPMEYKKEHFPEDWWDFYAGEENPKFDITLKALPKEGGELSINGQTKPSGILYGTEAVVSVKENKGYKLKSLKAGKKDILADKKFRVTSAIEVTAEFSEEIYKVTIEESKEGKISVTGAEKLDAVPYGTKLTAKAMSNKGYKVVSFTANGENILPNGEFIVKGATTVKAT